MKRSRFLLATALSALIAGTGLAVGQGGGGGAGGGGAGSSSPGSGSPGGAGGAGPAGPSGAGAEKGASPRDSQGSERSSQGPDKGSDPRDAQGAERRNGQPGRSGAENQSPGGSRAREAEDRNQRSNVPGQGRTDRDRRTDQDRMDRDSDRSRAQQQGRNPDREPGASSSTIGSSSSSVDALTSEQRTRVHQAFIRERNAPRVSNVNFSLSVGTKVPRSVRIARVPPSIVEIQPAWRGFRYFRVADQIVIIDDEMEIVAVISA